MTWAPPTKQPQGYCLSLLAKGDTLAQLAREARKMPTEIAAANGVTPPENPAKASCAWGRDVAAWVLGTGGARMPVVAGQVNTCEPGKGHVAFVVGQKIYLPAGLRPCAHPAPSTPPPKGFAVKAGAGAFAGLAALLLFLSRRKKATP